MKNGNLSAAQLYLYYEWFNALMAIENPPSDATVEDMNKLLAKLNKTRDEARRAQVPGI